MQNIMETFKRLPYYASTILFRAIAFSLTSAFLRYFTSIPIMILFVEQSVMAYMRLKRIEDNRRIEVLGEFFLCISNSEGTKTLVFTGLETIFNEV